MLLKLSQCVNTERILSHYEIKNALVERFRSWSACLRLADVCKCRMFPCKCRFNYSRDGWLRHTHFGASAVSWNKRRSVLDAIRQSLEMTTHKFSFRLPGKLKMQAQMCIASRGIELMQHKYMRSLMLLGCIKIENVCKVNYFVITCEHVNFQCTQPLSAQLPLSAK